MAEQKMTLVERLRNPQWIHDMRPGSEPALDVEQTRKDMKEAANLIEGRSANDNSQDAPRFDKIKRAAQVVLNHWDETGATEGFDEAIEDLRKAFAN